MDADPHLPAVKPEPRSPARNGDEEVGNQPLFSNVKMEYPFVKMETVFRELPIEFEPKTEAENDFPFTARENDSTEITVKENITNNSEMEENLTHPRIPAVRPEPDYNDEGSYTDIDISYSDVKQESSQYSKNAEQHTGPLRGTQNSVFKDSTVPVINSEPSPEYNVHVQRSRGRTQQLTRVKLFLCSLCTYTCKRKADLTRHNKTHTGEKPFSCPDCTYTCNRKVHLRDHMLTHAGVKLFSCSRCSYSCNRKGQLTSHMFIHSGDKPFSCSLCPFTCKQKGVLTSHSKTHSTEKPFSCPECSYTCCRKGVLRTHMNRHAGNRLISCSQCTYTCYLKQDLQSHMITHTGVKPFACGLCDFKCRRKKVLIHHIISLHPKETQ